MMEHMNSGFREKDFFIKNIDMYVTQEQILTWAFYLYGDKYLNSTGSSRVDFEHYAEQDLKKEKIKIILKNLSTNSS